MAFAQDLDFARWPSPPLLLLLLFCPPHKAQLTVHLLQEAYLDPSIHNYLTITLTLESVLGCLPSSTTM